MTSTSTNQNGGFSLPICPSVAPLLGLRQASVRPSFAALGKTLVEGTRRKLCDSQELYFILFILTFKLTIKQTVMSCDTTADEEGNTSWPDTDSLDPELAALIGSVAR